MDESLWQRLKQGDKTALETIYRQEVEALLQYGLKFTPDHGLVEDCLHDLFVDLWRNRAGLGRTDAIRPYLLASLRRLIVKRLTRHHQRFAEAPAEDHIFGAELAIDTLIEARELSEEQARRLERAFEQLSSRQREAVYLRYYEDLSYEDICQAMNINYQSVRNLVAGGIRALREAMILVIFYWWVCGFVRL